MKAISFDVVVPTVGRPSLTTLLAALQVAEGPPPGQVLLVDDRAEGAGKDVTGGALEGSLPPVKTPPVKMLSVETLHGQARGPAAARNAGWRVSSAEWVAFLDDDVVPDADWYLRLTEDLAAVGPEVAGVQGRLRVPLPAGRRPTDWERNVAGLEKARWATADMAYRRSVLEEVGGFDERFQRAFREDADLALRVLAAGYRLTRGRRTAAHPVRPAGPWVSVKLQAGNADDALMRAVHGRGWRRRASAPLGRIGCHTAVTSAAALGLAGLLTRNRRLVSVAGLAWLAGTAELAWARVAPGPRTLDEVATMVATSVAIPPAAVFHRVRGELQALFCSGVEERPAAVLLDRDGTLVHDVAYNHDPDKVVPMPGAREALERLRAAGVPTAVVSNQSGVARGLITTEQLEAVNRRVEELLGPLGPWMVCPHGPEEGCGCRKPAPGLVLQAAQALGVDPSRCALIGDIGPDVQAALAAGARAVMVPTPATSAEEVKAAPEVAPDLVSAVNLILGERP